MKINIINYLKTPVPERELLDAIFVTLFVFLIISITFDFAITYYNYIDLGETKFCEHEGNKLFVWGIEQNIPFILNPSVILNAILVGLCADFCLLYRKKRNRLFGFLAFASSIVMIIFTTLHFIGGLSWIL